MKHVRFILIGLLLSSSAISQIIKIQAGSSMSKLIWKIGDTDIGHYDETLREYCVFMGMDYLNKRYFNLSSNIGLVTKGGIGTTSAVGFESGYTEYFYNQKAILNYLSINSLIDIKYPIKERIVPFISIGPRFDYLMGYNQKFDVFNNMDQLEFYGLGFLLGGGLRYDFRKIQIGFRTDYYLNFNEIIGWPSQTDYPNGRVSDKTYTINLTIGYKIK